MVEHWLAWRNYVQIFYANYEDLSFLSIGVSRFEANSAKFNDTFPEPPIYSWILSSPPTNIITQMHHIRKEKKKFISFMNSLYVT